MMKNILKENECFEGDEQSQFIMIKKHELKRLYAKIEEYEKRLQLYENQYKTALATIEKYRK